MTEEKKELKWYAIQTRTNYEDKVKANLEQRIESFGLKEKFGEILVPKVTNIVVKDGRKKKVTKKLFPGYVLVQMMVDDNTWFIVRNTPDVTGFLGTGTVPAAIPEEEIERLKKQEFEEVKKAFDIDLEIGDLVTINDGPFKGYEGKVSEVDKKRGKAIVMISIFGKETPLELDPLQLTKM